MAFKDYFDVLAPILNLGVDVYKNRRRDSSQESMIDLLTQQENKNFEDTKNYNAALQDYYNKVQGAQAASSAASAATAKQQDALRRRALKKAMGVEKKNINKALGFYEPYRQAGLDVLPAHVQGFQSGMSGLNSLMSMLSTPESKSKLNQSVPAWSLNLPIKRG